MKAQFMSIYWLSCWLCLHKYIQSLNFSQRWSYLNMKYYLWWEHLLQWQIRISIFTADSRDEQSDNMNMTVRNADHKWMSAKERWENSRVIIWKWKQWQVRVRDHESQWEEELWACQSSWEDTSIVNIIIIRE